MNVPADQILDRFEGALLGTFAGDALGAPVEGWHATDIESQFGSIKDMIESGLWRGAYTDDTEMMIALAESLIRVGKLDEDDLAKSFLENYHRSRGYGPGTTNVLHLLREGIPLQEAALSVFPGGSYGNGCAMRVAPVGAFYFCQTDLLKIAAYAQSNVTHCHPLAREGSYLQALAVARLIEYPKDKRLDPMAFLAGLTEKISEETPSFQKAFEVIETFLRKFPNKKEVVDRLGHDIRVIRSQPTALYSFLSHTESFEEAVIYAVDLGGDTDTIGAMTGALAGAYHGAKAIPTFWLDVLENKAKGQDYIRNLARKLYDRCQT